MITPLFSRISQHRPINSPRQSLLQKRQSSHPGDVFVRFSGDDDDPTVSLTGWRATWTSAMEAGDHAFGEEDYLEAQEQFQRAYDIIKQQESSLRRRSELQELAETPRRLGYAISFLDDNEDAATYLTEAIGVYREIVAADATVANRVELAGAQEELGHHYRGRYTCALDQASDSRYDVDGSMGENWDGADEAYRGAITTLEAIKLADRSPRWQGIWTQCHRRLGELNWQESHYDDAINHFERALDGYIKSRSRYRVDIAWTQYYLADLYTDKVKAHGTFSESDSADAGIARGHLDDAIQTMRDFFSVEHPQCLYLTQSLSDVASEQGRTIPQLTTWAAAFGPDFHSVADEDDGGTYV